MLFAVFSPEGGIEIPKKKNLRAAWKQSGRQNTFGNVALCFSVDLLLIDDLTLKMYTYFYCSFVVSFRITFELWPT